MYCTIRHYSKANSSESPLAIYQIIILFACYVIIDFGLARSMFCCWVWLIVPRSGKAKFEHDKIVQK